MRQTLRLTIHPKVPVFSTFPPAIFSVFSLQPPWFLPGSFLPTTPLNFLCRTHSRGGIRLLGLFFSLNWSPLVARRSPVSQASSSPPGHSRLRFFVLPFSRWTSFRMLRDSPFQKSVPALPLFRRRVLSPSLVFLKFFLSRPSERVGLEVFPNHRRLDFSRAVFLLIQPVPRGTSFLFSRFPTFERLPPLVCF